MKKTREPIDILTKQDFLSTFYENISRIMVLVTIVGIVPIFLIGSIFYIKAGDLVFGIIEIVFAVILLIISTINIIPKDAKKTWLLLILYFFAVFTLITTGIKGAGASSILIVILFASIINRFSKRYLLFFINLITLSIITILLYLNVFGELEIANYKETWPFIFMVINLYAYGFIFVVGNYIRGLNDLSILSENQNAFLHSLINGIDEAIITINAAGHIVLMNNFAQELLGVNRQMNGENYQNFIREITQEMHKNNGETPILDGSLEDGTFVFVKNFSVQMKYLEKHVYTITNYDLHETHHIIILNDVTYKKIQEEELKQLSFHDFLTGLYNRRFYETELVRLNTKRFLPISLILCDINGLKLVNDSFGHQVGDEVLKGFASCLQKIGRSSDIIARIGGDEFIMLLPHTTANAAEKIIERLKQMTDECTVNNFELSYSIEYGTKSVEEININTLFKTIEDDLYKKKLMERSSYRSKTIDLILTTLYEKNPRELNHSNRVAQISKRIATSLGLEERVVREIEVAAMMHDIGKISIPESILDKPGKLEPFEMEKIKEHCVAGYRILSSVPEFEHVATYVYQHHEHFNGKGYPQNLKGNEITLEARIICIADAFDAMTNDRPYRKKLSNDVAMQILHDMAGTQFDPHIVKLIEKYPEIVLRD